MRWSFNPFTGNFDGLPNQGDSAKRLSDNRICGETISALKAVTAIDDETVELSEGDTYQNGKVLGISLTGGNLSDEIEVQLFGKVEDASFTFTLNEPLFLGVNGSIVSTPPLTGFLTNIGHSLGSGAIFIDIKDPIEL